MLLRDSTGHYRKPGWYPVKDQSGTWVFAEWDPTRKTTDTFKWWWANGWVADDYWLEIREHRVDPETIGT